MERRFTPQEMVEKLRRDEFSATLTMIGMVKLAEEDSEQLMFAPGTRCADWTSIPLDAVDGIEVLQLIPCDDHRHPLAALTFKTPGTPEGTMFAALLGAVNKPASVLLPPATGRPDGPRDLRYRLKPGVISTTETGGCATGCNPYDIFGDGIIRELYSCQTYGPGIYVCYYQ